MKKILLASAIFCATTGIAAAYTTPYVGASIGVINNSVTSKKPTPTGSFTSYRGIPVNLFAGYGGVIGQSLYLAAEIAGALGAANISDNDDLKSTYGMTGSILPGLMLNDQTLAFFRFGVAYSRFPNAANDSTWRTGGLLGLGLQASVSQYADIRGEYNFVAYESKNETMGGITYSVAPRSDQFLVSLVYRLE